MELNQIAETSSNISVPLNVAKEIERPISTTELNIEFDEPIGVEISLEENKNNSSNNPERNLNENNDTLNEDNIINKNEKRKLERKRRQERAKSRLENATTEAQRISIENDFFREKLIKLEQENQHIKSLAAQYQTHTFDQQIADIEARIKYYNQERGQALALADGVKFTQFDEAIVQERDKLMQLKLARQQTNFQNQSSPMLDIRQHPETQRHKARFFAQNDWFETNGYEDETAKVKAIDLQIAKEGYQMNTPAYWKELENRVHESLPDLYDDQESINDIKIKRNTVGGSSTMSTSNMNQSNSSKMYFKPHQKEALIKEGFLSEDGKTVLNKAKVIQRYKEYNKKEGR